MFAAIFFECSTYIPEVPTDCIEARHVVISIYITEPTLIIDLNICEQCTYSVGKHIKPLRYTSWGSDNKIVYILIANLLK